MHLMVNINVQNLEYFLFQPDLIDILSNKYQEIVFYRLLKNLFLIELE
jgi:hypothetical protein